MASVTSATGAVSSTPEQKVVPITAATTPSLDKATAQIDTFRGTITKHTLDTRLALNGYFSERVVTAIIGKADTTAIHAIALLMLNVAEKTAQDDLEKSKKLIQEQTDVSRLKKILNDLGLSETVVREVTVPAPEMTMAEHAAKIAALSVGASAADLYALKAALDPALFSTAAEDTSELDGAAPVEEVRAATPVVQLPEIVKVEFNELTFANLAAAIQALFAKNEALSESIEENTGTINSQIPNLNPNSTNLEKKKKKAAESLDGYVPLYNKAVEMIKAMGTQDEVIKALLKQCNEAIDAFKKVHSDNLKYIDTLVKQSNQELKLLQEHDQYGKVSATTGFLNRTFAASAAGVQVKPAAKDDETTYTETNLTELLVKMRMNHQPLSEFLTQAEKLLNDIVGTRKLHFAENPRLADIKARCKALPDEAKAVSDQAVEHSGYLAQFNDSLTKLQATLTTVLSAHSAAIDARKANLVETMDTSRKLYQQLDGIVNGAALPKTKTLPVLTKTSTETV